MIKLRLKRFGKKREVSYRIVAMQSTSRRDGRPLEELGYYNPRTDETRLDAAAIVRRLQQGAQPTPTVRRILEKANLFEQAKSGLVEASSVTTAETTPVAVAEEVTSEAAPEPVEATELESAATTEPAAAAAAELVES